MDAVPQIVVVEDTDLERELLVTYLTAQGFRASGVDRAAALHAVLWRAPPDLILLGMALPDADAVDLVGAVRAGQPEVGIILMAAAGDTMACVRGLDAGADDSVVRPFEPRELLARVRSVLRRLRPPGARAAAAQVRVGRCLFDLDRRELLDGNAAEHLAGGEFALLRTFAANPHRPLEPEWLAQVAAPEPQAADSIASRVEALRRKIERDPAHPLAIRTVAGVGYMFVPDTGEGAGGFD